MPVYKETIAALLAAAVLAVPAAAKDGRASKRPERPVLTTETALELACANNPSLAAAEARIEQARQQLAQARADKLPKLYAALAGAWQGEEGKVPAVVTVDPKSDPPKVFSGYALNSFEEAYQAALGVQWLLFSSGAVENTIAARTMAFRGIQTREVRTGQAVENAVLVSYYNLQRARAKLAVAEEVLALSKEHLSQVRNFFKYGVVAQDEVLRVEVDVSNGELNVISAKNAVDVRWRALERAVGTELRSKFDLPEPDRNAAPKDAPHWDEASLYALRPELKALDFSRRAALAVAAASRASTGPKIVAGGEVFNTGRDFWPDDLDTWKLSLSLRWDFYDGGKARAQVKEYRARAQELLAQIEDVKRQVALEVSSAQLNFESARQRIDVASRQVASAQEDYRMALLRYKSSVGTNLDVLDARTALTNARTQLVDAVYDMNSSRADLDYALGLSERFKLPDAVPPAAAGRNGAKN
ncbi:TolC family protein [Pyramidobacter sp. YE332]|nr:TolC family protein [Pyramidobacter sp. YE332]OON88799.1 transporter [Pyramidobacter sp. C12-8]WOL41322.1 TolC family protein [Pyramidobacter sp. YE332]